MLRPTVFALLLLATVASADDGHPDSNPVRDYAPRCIVQALTTGAAYARLSARFPASGDKYSPIFDEARSCLDAKFMAALDAAGANADLRDALKNFHVAAGAWLAEARSVAGGPAAYERRVDPMRSALQVAMDRVRMEAQIAAAGN